MSKCSEAKWLEALEKKNWECEPKDIEEAIEVQKRVTKVAETVWGNVIGVKVALTSESSRRLFGGGPITGPLFKASMLGSGSEVELALLSDPLLEPEIMFCDGNYFVAFEVPDNRYGKKWEELNWLMLTADLAGAYKVIVGDALELSEGDKIILSTPGGSIEGTLNLDKVENNMRLVEDADGCKLLGTVLPPIKPQTGTYVLQIGKAKVKVKFV